MSAIPEFDAAARQFVLPRNAKYERNMLSQLADPTAIVNLAGVDERHAGQSHAPNTYANSHASRVPGGAIYFSHGLDPRLPRQMGEAQHIGSVVGIERTVRTGSVKGIQGLSR